MRRLLSIMGLALCSFAIPEGETGSAEPSIEEKIEALEKERARLVEERDAARIRANTFVLPKDKLEAQEKEAEIEETDRELESLRQKAREEGRKSRSRAGGSGPR